MYDKKCNNCDHFQEAQLIQNFSSPCFECKFSGLGMGATEDYYKEREDLCERCREPSFERLEYQDKWVCTACWNQLDNGDAW